MSEPIIEVRHLSKSFGTHVVLRDGELVTTLQRGEADTTGIAKLMVGRNVDFSTISGRPQEEIEGQEVVLKIKDLCVDMPGESAKGVNIDIHKGEILGFCGLAGQGKLAIANGIAGLYPSTGEVIYKGSKLPFRSPLEILKQGIGCKCKNVCRKMWQRLFRE